MTSRKTPTKLDELDSSDRCLVECHTLTRHELAEWKDVTIGGKNLIAYYALDHEDLNKVTRVIAVVENDTGKLIGISSEKVRELIQETLKKDLPPQHL